MKKLRDHTPKVMNKVVQIFLYIVIIFTVNGTLYSQDDILFVSEKNEFSEVSFFGVGGTNYLMKDNPKGERFGAGFDVGMYYRTAKFLHIGITAGLHSVHTTRMDYDYDRLVRDNNIKVLEMSIIDFSHISYLIPFALCGRFDVASKDIIPFIRVDAGINYIMTDSKGTFTKVIFGKEQPSEKYSDSFGFISPFLALGFGIDYPITPSLALSGILKIHTTYSYQTRDIGLRQELVDFSPQYTILSLGITKTL